MVGVVQSVNTLHGSVNRSSATQKTVRRRQLPAKRLEESEVNEVRKPEATSGRSQEVICNTPHLDEVEVGLPSQISTKLDNHGVGAATKSVSTKFSHEVGLHEVQPRSRSPRSWMATNTHQQRGKKGAPSACNHNWGILGFLGYWEVGTRTLDSRVG